jgi:hypothetical protein
MPSAYSGSPWHRPRKRSVSTDRRRDGAIRRQIEDLRQSVRASHAACGSIGLMRQQEDWYAYLSIATDAPTEQIEQAVERLSRQATALAVTAPERSQRLRDTVRSIKRDLLSGPEARARYDAGREAAVAPSQPRSQVPPSQMPPPAMPSPASASIPPPPTVVPPPPSYPPPPMAPTSPAAGGPYGGGPYGSAAYGGGGGPTSGPGGAPTGGPGGGGPGSGGPAGGGPGGGERIGARLVRFLRTGWVCAECGKEAVPSDKFCTRCGTAIIPTRHEAAPPTTRVTCVNCAAPVGGNDAFCSRCGTRVSK